MTQRRIFAFLWPDAPPGPVDAQARQDRYTRISGRGPLRLMLLLVFSVLTFAVGFIGALVVTAYPTLPALAVVGITLAGLVTMLARSWQVGTYVSDHGVRDITFRRTTQVPWSDVTSIESDRRRVQLNTRFDSVSPHVARHGLDFIGRHEAYDMAVDRLTNWWQQR